MRDLISRAARGSTTYLHIQGISQFAIFLLLTMKINVRKILDQNDNDHFFPQNILMKASLKLVPANISLLNLDIMLQHNTNIK